MYIPVLISFFDCVGICSVRVHACVHVMSVVSHTVTGSMRVSGPSGI